MGLFDQAKDLYKLQKQAKQIKQQLKNLHIEAEVNGIIVTISGEMEVMDVKIPKEMMSTEKHDQLQKDLLAAINKAMKKAQEVAAEKMRGMMGGMGMNLPGGEA
jgi:DNA-binding protein YbaB